MKNFKKVGGRMGNAGRPKLEIARTERLYLRLTKFELEEISALAKKLNLTKTETVLRGIKLLKNPPKQKIYKNLNKNSKKQTEGIIEGETVMFNKN